MSLRIASRLAITLVAASLTACGDSKSSLVTPSLVNYPAVAGSYNATWTTQYNRTVDGYNGAFTCFGSLTLTQEPNSPDIKGFAVVSNNCPPLSFDLSGSVTLGGEISFRTGGPKPSGGPCPAPPVTNYTGSFTTVGSSLTISARGLTSVNCPGELEGEYKFTQLISAQRFR
jgi:hypothetical protein